MRETKRTRWFTAFLHMLLAPFFRWKFGYRYDDFSAVPGPYLLLANHNMDLDPALLGVAAGQDIRFVASEHVLRKGLGSWFLTRCFDPIVHTKGKLGLKSSMDILRSIRKGERVALFPEGNRSFNGVTGAIPPVTGKLARSTGAPLITFRFEGGYFTQPRWSVRARRGEVVGHLVRVYAPEELRGMTDEEVTEAIRKDLYEDAYRSEAAHRVAYRGRELARGLEAAIFACPACGAIGTLRSHGDTVRCACGFSAQYTVYGELFDHTGRLHTVTDWDRLQQRRLRALLDESAEDDILFSDEVTAEQIGANHGVEQTYRKTLAARKDGVLFGDTWIPLDEIRGLAVHSRNTLTAHIGATDTQYELRGDESFSALKYLYLYQNLREKE